MEKAERNKKLKVYVVGPQQGYARFIKNHELVDSQEKADVVIFTGGEDVSPSLYGCKKHPTTCSNLGRDKEEKRAFDKIRPDQLAVGICRGSQFLCVMNGGKLIQNCRNHAIGRTHEITDGKVAFQITSTHHQMQYPFELKNDDYTMLYWAGGLSGDSLEGDGIDMEEVFKHGEPEIVLYHKEGKAKCLAIQGHPEMMAQDAPVVEMINDLIKNYAN